MRGDSAHSDRTLSLGEAALLWLRCAPTLDIPVADAVRQIFHRELRVLSQGHRESSNRRWNRHRCADTNIDPGTGIYLMSACYGGRPDSAARISGRTGA